MNAPENETKQPALFDQDDSTVVDVTVVSGPPSGMEENEDRTAVSGPPAWMPDAK